MKAGLLKQIRWERRKKCIRKRIHGTPGRPRLSVYRSLKHVYAQLIDDTTGRTLVSVGSLQLKLAQGGNVAAARQVGQVLAERAKAAGIRQVVFDRNGFTYHGRVKALAEAARQGGLKF